MSGKWFFLTHHGTGSWEGRPLSLLPVTWMDDWPIIGQPGPDGLGYMIWCGQKPVLGSPVVTVQVSDEFDSPTLGPQWEWNHQPRNDKWSLTDRPGWLRLYAFRPLHRDNILRAGNTISQRVLRTASNCVTVKIDLTGMAEGQKAGLCHYARCISALGAARSNGMLYLEYRLNTAITCGPALTNNLIWLRAYWGLDGQCRYAWSLDGHHFYPIGSTHVFDWGHYRGTRTALYCFNNLEDAGYIDVEFFHYHFQHRCR